MAEEGDGAASEASEWENREREEQLALLREEEERLGAEGLGGQRCTSFRHSLSIFLGLSFVFLFCHTTSGGQRVS